jgi:hypothetical protein
MRCILLLECINLADGAWHHDSNEAGDAELEKGKDVSLCVRVIKVAFPCYEPDKD